MNKAVWVEAALNGPWTRKRQPLIPVTVEELIRDGIACAKAGAGIVHLHAYDPDTGIQNDDPETYVRIIEGIRAVEDVIVYPTVPFTVGPDVFADGAAASRYRALEVLAQRGLLEWGVVDPGSINLATFDDVAGHRNGSIYLNPEAHIRYGLELARRVRFNPSFAIYEPGFLRLGAALLRAMADPPKPIYRFMFTQMFTFGLPPAPFALQTYLELLRREAIDAPWMAAGLGVDLLGLAPEVIAAGGHLRVGLEDAPLGTDVGNVAWVDRAVAAVQSYGKEPATAGEVRSSLDS